MGDSTDVHPRQKKQIGERLALWALNKTYDHSEIIPSGPLFHDLYFENESAWISFEFSEGLQTSDGKPLRSFEIAEFPGHYFSAEAHIIDNVVKVNSPYVSNPKYIRYGWSSYSDGNLINKQGLPASTFSTQYE